MKTKIKITLLVLSSVIALTVSAKWTNQSVTKIHYLYASFGVDKQLSSPLNGVCLYQSMAGGKTSPMAYIFIL